MIMCLLNPFMHLFCYSYKFSTFFTFWIRSSNQSNCVSHRKKGKLSKNLVISSFEDGNGIAYDGDAGFK